MYTVNVSEDGKIITNENDPSDVWDYLISKKSMPKQLFLAKGSDTGLTWKDLPLRFGWNGKFYIVSIDEWRDGNGANSKS
jgi:hypothetical protein